MKPITAPKSLMGQHGFCPRGGQDGILVTGSKLAKFAKKLGNKSIDLVIPLPVHVQVHPDDCTQDHDGMCPTIYWEDEKGSHGWCCVNCGTVVQWG